jgi:hypothetical protein
MCGLRLFGVFDDAREICVCFSRLCIRTSNYFDKEERNGGAVDKPFMICTLNVMLGKFSLHIMKIEF